MLIKLKLMTAKDLFPNKFNNVVTEHYYCLFLSVTPKTDL